MDILTDLSKKFKDTYFKFHDKDETGINTFITSRILDDSLYIQDIHQNLYEFYKYNNLLEFKSIINPVYDEDDDIVEYIKTDEYFTYTKSNKIFTHIIKEFISEDFDDHSIDFNFSHEYLTNNFYENDLLIFSQDNLGNTSTNLYDKKNNIIQQSSTDHPTSYLKYDKNNNIIEISDGEMLINYTYRKNMLIEESLSINNILKHHAKHSYDKNNNIIVTENQHGIYKYAYNSLNLITSIIDDSDNPFEASIEYDNNLHLKSSTIIMPNNHKIITNYEFNNDHILLALSINKNQVFKNFNKHSNSTNNFKNFTIH